jgi:hypothetical protein
VSRSLSGCSGICGRWPVRYISASALSGDNYALVPKHFDGAACGRTGYAAQIHDVFLARYPAPGQILTRLDPVSEPPGYLLVGRLGRLVVDLYLELLLHMVSVPVPNREYPLSYRSLRS